MWHQISIVTGQITTIRDEDRDKESVSPSRWREFVGQPLHIFQNIMRSTPEAKGKRIIVTLFLIFGIFATAGPAWQSYPKIRSAFQSSLGEKKLRGESIVPKKPISPAVAAPMKQTSLAYPSAAPQKTESVATLAETPKEEQIQAQDRNQTRPTGCIPTAMAKRRLSHQVRPLKSSLTAQTEVVAPHSDYRG